MGTIYIFRGIAATGKSTLANMLALRLSIPIFCKDDIVDVLKSSKNIDEKCISNEVCYNILHKIIQTNLNLNADFILDLGLGDRNNANWFFNRLNFRDNTIYKFLTYCSDKKEWLKRHLDRLENPLLHQSFRSIEHVMEHYEKADITPFDDEHLIDTSKSIDECFDMITNLI